MSKDRYAGQGQVWVCMACGKMADHDRYGMEGATSPGWDESCVMNSVLCKQDSIKTTANGRVTHADAVDPEKAQAEAEAKSAALKNLDWEIKR